MLSLLQVHRGNGDDGVLGGRLTWRSWIGCGVYPVIGWDPGNPAEGIRRRDAEGMKSSLVQDSAGFFERKEKKEK